MWSCGRKQHSNGAPQPPPPSMPSQVLKPPTAAISTPTALTQHPGIPPVPSQGIRGTTAAGTVPTSSRSSEAVANLCHILSQGHKMAAGPGARWSCKRPPPALRQQHLPPGLWCTGDTVKKLPEHRMLIMNLLMLVHTVRTKCRAGAGGQPSD